MGPGHRDLDLGLALPTDGLCGLGQAVYPSGLGFPGL